jgi:hypothetical protein
LLPLHQRIQLELMDELIFQFCRVWTTQPNKLDGTGGLASQSPPALSPEQSEVRLSYEAFFTQRTGRFFIRERETGTIVRECRGYAGRGPGKNNPQAQGLRNLGPLPRGRYLVRPPHYHPRLGPMAFRLVPQPSNEMCGRSGFLIHGDSRRNPGQASRGCIILGPADRAALVRYRPNLLTVRT